MNIWDHEDILVFLTRGIILFSAFVVMTSFSYVAFKDFSLKVDAFLDNDSVANLSGADSLQEIIANGHPFLIKDSQGFSGEPEAIGASSAIAVLVKNNRSNVLFSQVARKKLPIASLTKLMTALVVLEKYDLNQVVTVDASALSQEGEQGVLKIGDSLSVKSLLEITLIESSNRSAYALSEVMGPKKFVEEMNATAKRIGLENTYFADSTGLSENSYSTTEDLVILTKYLFEHYPLFREIVSSKELDVYTVSGVLHHHLASTNKLLGEVPEVIGGKTGYTTIARGCFMVIQKGRDNSEYFINVVLGAEDRFLEMQKIINWIKSQS